MSLHRQEALIVSLAQMLTGKQVGLKALHTALSLLCEEFSFDCALLYEVDRYNNCLHLAESCGAHSAQTMLTLDSFSPELYNSLAQKSMIYCHDQLHQTKEQSQLLSLLGVHSVAAVSSVDEAECIYGLITLCNAVKNTPLDETSCKNLETALSILSNNSAVRIYQNRIRFAQTALESILDNTGIDIYVNDFYSHEILYVNESMAMPYGGKSQFVNHKCWQVLFPGQTGPCGFCPQNRLVDEEGMPTKVYTWDYQRAFDGAWFRVFSTAFRWVDGRLAHVVSSADITDNKRNEELIRYMANYDSLTNLPNRRMLVAECEQRISSAAERQAYLLFFDIDGFKNINDSLGHDAGDEFLVKLGAFFTDIPLLKNCIYRNGGDEFVALLGENITEDNVRNLSRFIHMRFQKPWELKNGTISCGISIGGAQYPRDGTTAEELLCKADQAMYRVKKKGGNGVFFFGEEE